ncbi:MAG: BrnT family toxin [Deltaproteobacteria bacterium]|nr:BrnT family toxin [Deltaproteobacteria bacterium]
MEFEWDADKELGNIKKHGVTFQEAVECFFDEHAIQLEDPKHSRGEARHYLVGRTKSGRVLTTRFTYRGAAIRIIGSGEWRKGRKLYHERAKLEKSQD